MSPDWTELSPDAAGRYLREHPEAVVLDVRSPGEFAARRLPGAALIPVQELGGRWRELSPRQPLLVHCEHGVRSRNACAFLAQLGFTTLANLTGGLAAWDEPRHGPTERGTDGPRVNPLPPAELPAWLPLHLELPASGRALDLAAGRGRVSRYLRAEGFAVTAVDRDIGALEPLRSAGVDPVALDLEAPGGARVLAESGPFEFIAAVNYLHRPLLPALAEMLAPGGWLFYRTFVADPRAGGGPRNPDHLLRPGELPAAFSALELREYRDRFDGATRAAALFARKPDRS